VEKIPLYAKLHAALKENGYFILTDYFSLSEAEEIMHRQNLAALKAEQGIGDDDFYHYDTPLTVKHETEALLEAGFSNVQVLNHWGATCTLKAVK
jgi:tRNA (cmo5U34)-methyltransferase